MTATLTPTEAAPSGPTEGRRDGALRGRLTFDRWGLLALPLLVFLLVVFIAPLAFLIASSVTDPTLGLDNYRKIFTESVYLRVLVNTFTVALTVTAVTLALAYPYAYLMTIATPRWRALLTLIILVPFWTSILVRSFALVLLLRDTGVLNSIAMSAGAIDEPVPLLRTMTGVVFGMVQIALPFAVLPMYATMRTIDRRLLDAAQGMGDRPSGAFWRVFVPLSMPGVAAGLILTFIQALGYYITPALLGGPKNTMIGELIVQQVSTVLQFGFAAALAVILLGTTFVLLAITSKFMNLERMLMGRS
ncbi:ABC transporter permease [Aeromicrobium phragmitis]|uniref:ABC transporter permease n=1 Tax=Aeromicrobium phragmitis TaxID=2478914 RepID=A0A3L8PRX9_9ACTN|nr:ABC transporter permease [Aeromicrobium phragmitis]RLV57413.1 ABC transporter permease [Aeromicrobium phragmitis]